MRFRTASLCQAEFIEHFANLRAAARGRRPKPQAFEVVNRFNEMLLNVLADVARLGKLKAN